MANGCLLSTAQLIEEYSNIVDLLAKLTHEARDESNRDPSNDALMDKYLKATKMAYSFKMLIESTNELAKLVISLRQVIESHKNPSN